MNKMLAKKWFVMGCCALGLQSSTYANPTPSNSWLKTALQLQREIDIDAPLNEATFLGTHNSYNSKAYQILYKRYLDPNQLLSLTDQLNQGIRSIELDTHWTFASNLRHAILLCHSFKQEAGCSLFDKRVEDGLLEIRHWLDDNPNEVVLLYLERFLDGHEPRLADFLEIYLGPYIYRTPVAAGSSQCTALPSHLTKAQILASGKRLIIITKGCSNPGPNADNHFNQLVFAGSGPIASNPHTFIDAQIQHFNPAPDCSAKTVFGADPDHTSLWRIYEDQTMVGQVVEDSQPILEKDVAGLNQCNINWIGFDMLERHDSRLAAAIWSWASHYPKAGAGECAAQRAGLGIINRDCNTHASGFLCRSAEDNHLEIVTKSATWVNGESICQQLGAQWHFSTPVNGKEMASIKAITKDNQDIWLNYHTFQSHWYAHTYYQKDQKHKR